MKIFGFRKKSKIADEINGLLKLLEENPEDVKSRLMLANLYLETGDQETAIKEYHATAKQLSAEGLDLEPIAIYKKIFSLDGISLTEKSLASVQEAEELLVKARKTYEEILQVESQDGEAKEASESHERGDDLQEEEIPRGDDSEPVAIEVLAGPSQDQAVPKIESSESHEKHSPNQETSSLGTSPSGALRESYCDGGDQEPLEFPDKAVDERDIQNSVHEAEITPATDSSYPKEDLQIDLNDLQMDEDLETMLSDYETETPTGDPLPPDASGALGDGDLSVTPSAFQEPDPRQESSQLDTTQSILKPSHQKDPDLPYNLGIAYYEMDLMDKAIKEFAKAHNQGIKTVESLSMLAKCYFKKGLFHNGVGLIVQALKLDNLTQEQIDMLQGQLEEIKAKINLADSPPLRQSGS